MLRPAPLTAAAAPLLAALAVTACQTPPSGDDETASATTSATATDTATTGDTGTSAAESESESDTDTGVDPGDLPISVIWDDAGPALLLLRGDETLLRFPADGFQLGVVAAIDASKSYDPVFSQPDQWLTITAAGPEQGGAAVARRLTFTGGAEADLVVSEDAPGRFSATLTPVAGGPTLAFLRLRPEVDAGENFYGLGELFDRPEHRGAVRALQLEFDGSIESGNNEAHVPVPLVIGTRGWGLFVESPYAAVFDVAAAAGDRVDATFGTGPASGDGLRFHLFGAGHPLDITRHYYDVSGDPLLPAPWVLGPLVWRDENDDQAQIEADLQAMRALDLPTSGIWIDRPYASAVNTFDFEAARFPDPQAMIDLAHALGFRVALWHTPYLDPGDPASKPLADEAEDAGYFPPKISLLTSPWGPPLDLTNPAAYAWWRAKIELYQAMGIEGYKLDYGEDVTVGINGARTEWAFADGSDERTMHTFYSTLYHRVYRETLPENGGFILARAGGYGGQTEASVIWPGDLEASLRRHREPADGYVSVGGLPAAVSASLSLGPSGYPLFASDTGGYRHSPPDKETFVRWFSFTALTPVMQIGTSTNDVAWEPTPENGFDAETLAWYREYTRLHIRLFPYLWTYVDRLAVDGRPIQRALGLAHPELGVHPADTYLLGDHLLVAPVVDAGAVARSVTFPAGQWIDWFTGAVIDGGQTIEVPAPLGALPLYVRAGAIVPLLRPGVDTLASASDPGVDAYADDPGALWPRLSPGPASSFELFDGAMITQAADAATITLSVDPGAVFDQGALLTVIAAGPAPQQVTDNGAPLPALADLAALGAAESGYAHDAGLGGSIHVKVGGGAHTLVITR